MGRHRRSCRRWAGRTDQPCPGSAAAGWVRVARGAAPAGRGEPEGALEGALAGRGRGGPAARDRAAPQRGNGRCGSAGNGGPAAAGPVGGAQFIVWIECREKEIGVDEAASRSIFLRRTIEVVVEVTRTITRQARALLWWDRLADPRKAFPHAEIALLRTRRRPFLTFRPLDYHVSSIYPVRGGSRRGRCCRFNEGRDEARDCVLGCRHCHSKSCVMDGAGGDGADGGDARRAEGRDVAAEHLDEVADGGGRGEGDDVDLARAKTAHAFGIGIAGDGGAVETQLVDAGALRVQPFDQRVARTLGAWEEDACAAEDAAVERVEQAFGDVLTRDEIGGDAGAGEGGGGAGTDGGDAGAGEGAGGEAAVVQMAHEDADGVGAGEDDPAVSGGAEIVDSGRDLGGIRGLDDLDRGELDGFGALLLEEA